MATSKPSQVGLSRTNIELDKKLLSIDRKLSFVVCLTVVMMIICSILSTACFMMYNQSSNDSQVKITNKFMGNTDHFINESLQSIQLQQMELNYKLQMLRYSVESIKNQLQQQSKHIKTLKNMHEYWLLYFIIVAIVAVSQCRKLIKYCKNVNIQIHSGHITKTAELNQWSTLKDVTSHYKIKKLSKSITFSNEWNNNKSVFQDRILLEKILKLILYNEPINMGQSVTEIGKNSLIRIRYNTPKNKTPDEWHAIIGKNEIYHEPAAAQPDEFQINIFARETQITLNEKVTTETTISQIKHSYKHQSGVSAEINDIHLYVNSMELPSNKTLQDVGITNDLNLVTIKFAAAGGYVATKFTINNEMKSYHPHTDSTYIHIHIEQKISSQTILNPLAVEFIPVIKTPRKIKTKHRSPAHQDQNVQTTLKSTQSNVTQKKQTFQILETIPETITENITPQCKNAKKPKKKKKKKKKAKRQYISILNQCQYDPPSELRGRGNIQISKQILQEITNRIQEPYLDL
eukprot:776_1